jgi:hypothetical protein
VDPRHLARVQPRALPAGGRLEGRRSAASGLGLGYWPPLSLPHAGCSVTLRPRRADGPAWPGLGPAAPAGRVAGKVELRGRPHAVPNAPTPTALTSPLLPGDPSSPQTQVLKSKAQRCLDSSLPMSNPVAHPQNDSFLTSATILVPAFL